MSGRGACRRARRAPKRPPPAFGDLGEAGGLAARAAEYLEWLAVHHYSAETIRTRHHQLHNFWRWCADRGLAYPHELTHPILERYQRWLYYYRRADGRPLSLMTQHDQLAGVKAYFRWLTRQRHILYNPAAELEMPRTQHRLPRQVLTAAEAEAVLAQAGAADPLSVRDRALLETLYSTAIRRMEALALGLYDLDRPRGLLLIREGKGRRDRVVPVGARALAWIDKYLSDVRPRLAVPPDEGFLFLNNRGDGFTPKHLSQLVRGYVQKAAVGKTGACHLFRHTAATLMLENGADIRYIQQLLGHAKLETTAIYTRVSIRQLQAIHRATHPAGRQEPGGCVAAAAAALHRDQPEALADELLDALDAEADDE